MYMYMYTCLRDTDGALLDVRVHVHTHIYSSAYDLITNEGGGISPHITHLPGQDEVGKDEHGGPIPVTPRSRRQAP